MPSQHFDELADAEHLGMHRITALLVDEFGGRYGSGVIEQLVSEFLAEMIPTATITTYLPLLAERSVRDRIRTRPPELQLAGLLAAIDTAKDGKDGTNRGRADDVPQWAQTIGDHCDDHA